MSDGMSDKMREAFKDRRHREPMDFTVSVRPDEENRFHLDARYAAVRPVPAHRHNREIGSRLSIFTSRPKQFSKSAFKSRLGDMHSDGDYYRWAVDENITKSFPGVEPWPRAEYHHSFLPLGHMSGVYTLERQLGSDVVDWDEDGGICTEALRAGQNMISREVGWAMFVVRHPVHIENWDEHPAESHALDDYDLDEARYGRLLAWNFIVDRAHATCVLFDRVTGRAFYVDSATRSRTGFENAVRHVAAQVEGFGWRGQIRATALGGPMQSHDTGICACTVLEALEMLVVRDWPADGLSDFAWDDELGWAAQLGPYLRLPNVKETRVETRLDVALCAKWLATCRFELKSEPSATLYRGFMFQWNYVGDIFRGGEDEYDFKGWPDDEADEADKADDDAESVTSAEGS
ncbi:hypothetical protein C8034_v010280 [Colletotrichum sidae]|uniref:Uncharacterized protein n=1 Tax=Colletotrichum sidae TaxID=1347389 RepID=A0A4V3I3N1_9PEZI|nr:hypothetical protein C8034_v010280 [Colletotrichum sidae]